MYSGRMTKDQVPVVVLAGASGFIGSAVADAFVGDGYEVRLVGRNAPVRWDDPDALGRAVEGADVVVNFAGKSVNCRYTDRNRDEILASRVQTTRALRVAVARADHPPRVWMNASTATIYRHAMDRANTEDSGEIGSGFSVDVATSWERELFEGSLPKTRRVSLRMAIVVGDGPATRMLFTLTRWGLGGTQFDGWCPPHRRYRGIGDHPTGSDRAPWHRTHGRQKFSWVHIDDVVAAVRFIRDVENLSGPINIASPQPSENSALMRTLRRAVGRRVGLPSLRWMLELAMWVIPTEPELVLKSRWVIPKALTDAGFTFSHPNLEEALTDVHTRRGRANTTTTGAARTEKTTSHAA
tara:strand:- start:6680 stop:7741 length:1062 start_codon:yes stop_codon:yes gene_type:complete